MNFLKFLSSFSLIYFSLLGWCVNSWFTLWILMEASFLFFVVLVVFDANYGVTEFLIKYFIVQILSGVGLLICLLLWMFQVSFNMVWLNVIFLFVKIGFAPFHFWLISILGKMPWLGAFFMFTFMKLLPLLMMIYSLELQGLWCFLCLPALVGSLWGMGNSAIQKVLGYSGMVNGCWLLAASAISDSVFFFFFLGYVFVLFSLFCLFNSSNFWYVSQFKFNSFNVVNVVIFFLGAVNFSGIPPFLGFFIKLMVSFSYMFMDFSIFFCILVLFSLFSLIYYFNIYFYFMIISFFSSKSYVFNFYCYIWSFSFFFISFLLLFFSLGF
uniref:NADH-ubiquinone oxidoreductase chain 2 n=1 Tax=Tetraleurodes acaciae TaxID=267835 RepID=Q674N9_TETAA|nr:NADH dehydrogenase subunit 2 [Tetraleurodes acaciae]AAU14160.1 NADH dehydrogenase subunit 2 [Tetraleurodes acaciae]